MVPPPKSNERGELTATLPISARGTNLRNMHYFAKSQNSRDEIHDTKFINTCLFAKTFKKISVCSKMLVE